MSENNVTPCPTCDAKGELFVSGICYGDGSSGPYSQMAPCPDCLGKGTLTAEQLKWKERGKNIREWRRAKGLTLIQAANRFGLRVTEYSKVESGRIDNSEWERLLKGASDCDKINTPIQQESLPRIFKESYETFESDLLSNGDGGLTSFLIEGLPKNQMDNVDSVAVDQVIMPVVGEVWSCRGFTFRVDDVQNGEVYFVRWRGDQKLGVPMRCDISLWQSEMAEATKIRSE